MDEHDALLAIQKVINRTDEDGKEFLSDYDAMVEITKIVKEFGG